MIKKYSSSLKKKLAIYDALKHVLVLDCGFINIHGHQFI